jgi:hypothetical protein
MAFMKKNRKFRTPPVPSQERVAPPEELSNEEKNRRSMELRRRARTVMSLDKKR